MKSSRVVGFAKTTGLLVKFAPLDPGFPLDVRAMPLTTAAPAFMSDTNDVNVPVTVTGAA